MLEKYLDVNDNTLTPEQKRLLNLEINMVEQEDAASIEEVSSLTLGF